MADNDSCVRAVCRLDVTLGCWVLSPSHSLLFTATWETGGEDFASSSSPCPAVTVYGSGVLRCACEGEGMGGEAK